MEVDSKTKNSVEDRTRTSKHSTIMKNDDGAVWLRGKADKYRNNASKRPPGRCDCARVKRFPEEFLGKNISGLLPLRGDTKKEEKNTCLSHTATAQQKQKVLVMSQPSSTEKAPSTDKSTDDHSNSRGSLRRPGQAAPTREGTPAPGPAPATASAAQQVLQRGPLPRVVNIPMQSTPLPASETASFPSLKRLASSAPGRSPPKNEGGGAFTVFLLNEGALTPEHARFR